MHAFTCLLFPFIGACQPFVDYGASPSDLLRTPSYYAMKAVVVSGNAHKIKQLRGASFGTPAELFLVCDNRCVQVFMRAHTGMFDGERVSIRGLFVTSERVGHISLRNAIEANEVLPRV